eukprot:1059996_1
MGNSSHIIYYINLSIIFIIGFPIIVYSFWLLYLNWDTPLLLQRRRSLSVLILILVSVLLLFFEPLITSFYLLKDTTSAPLLSNIPHHIRIKYTDLVRIIW